MNRVDSARAGKGVPATSRLGPGSKLHAFWQQRNARERRMLAVGASVLVLALLWLLGVEPALDGRERWRKDLPQLRADAALVQSLSQRLASASSRPATAAQPLNKAALESSLTAAGLKPQSLTLQDAGGVQLVRANFTDASFSALTEWLQQQQRASQLSVSELSVSARERLDRVDAQLTLRRQP